jgi:hypothetical protein
MARLMEFHRQHFFRLLPPFRLLCFRSRVIIKVKKIIIPVIIVAILPCDLA